MNDFEHINNQKALIPMIGQKDFINNRYVYEQTCQTEVELLPIETTVLSYEASSTDVQVQLVNNPRIKFTIPEIKAHGTIGLKKYAPFIAIKSVEVLIVNPSIGKEESVNKLSGQDLLEHALASKPKEYFHNSFGEDDSYCIMREGTFLDDTVFKEREVRVPLISLIPENFLIFDETKIIFRFTFNPLKDILVYNETFKTNSLSSLEMTSYKNITLLFSNTKISNTINTEKYNYPTSYFLRKKEVCAKPGTSNFNSATFKNSFGVIISNKTNIFNSNYKFISVPEDSTNPKELIKKWILKVLKDVIIITDLDMTEEENKTSLGFDVRTDFQEVENNIIYFDNDKRKSCKIFIEGVPDTHSVFYNKNVLTFSRGYDKHNILNISELFKKIKGVCFKEDSCKIEFLYESIEHNIDLKHVSIPIDIWCHPTNTEPGDLRSKYSKLSDVYYNNPFTQGMDFLSKDKGYSSCSLNSGNPAQLFSNPNTDLKFYKQFNIFFLSETDENSFVNKSLFATNSTYQQINCVYADTSNNFDKFVVKIVWNKYLNSNPKTLYDRIPVCTVCELMQISYKENKVIVIEPMVRLTK